MRIEPLEAARASDEVRETYAELERAHGRVSTFYKMLAYKPHILSAFRQLESAVLTDGTLPIRLKDLAYLRASLLNGCARCARAHAARAVRGGFTEAHVAALKEPGGTRAPIFSPEERAVLRFTDLLTSYPANIDPSDLDALGRFFTTEQIVELAATIATANWTNRINEGLRTPI